MFIYRIVFLKIVSGFKVLEKNLQQKSLVIVFPRVTGYDCDGIHNAHTHIEVLVQTMVNSHSRTW